MTLRPCIGHRGRRLRFARRGAFAGPADAVRDAAVAAGWTQTNWAAAFFPATSIPYLAILSQVGVIFFLFLVGLELDPKLLRNRGHAALVISHVSIVAPFLLGAGLTLYL